MPNRSMRERQAVCERYLIHNKSGYLNARNILQTLADTMPADVYPDQYGENEYVTQFEDSIAGLLGKESAVFMPSGTMTQQLMLRIIADRQGNRKVAYHPTCHLELHEQKAYQHLHDLQAILIGRADLLLKPSDVFTIKEPFASLLLELPQREIGGQLPPWEELQEISQWTHEHGVHLHMDGARFWQCGPFYGRSLAEIAALFDTVYVSFYKILGGIAGAALCGPRELMEEARLWRHRQGGKLFGFYPLVASAQIGLKQHLPLIPAYVEKARSIAARLETIPGIRVTPNPPHINMMHLYLDGENEALMNAYERIIDEDKVYMFNGLQPTRIPGMQKVELTIGDAALEISDDEIQGLFEKLMRYSKG